MGYVILKNSDYLMDTQMLFEVLTVIQETMEHMYQRIILRKINDELSTLYIMDSLTGLYNRMAYTKLAVPLFEKCKYQKQPLMIMFVDLDRLKYINDTFGHDMGNLAIKVISESVQKCCPDEGIAMRYGGDEFVVLIPGYNKDATEELLAEIQKEIAKNDPKNAGKPDSIIEKMVAGRVSKSLQDLCLVDQAFILDGNKKVSAYLSENNSSVESFVLYVVGEGIEKKKDNWVEEVQAALK